MNHKPQKIPIFSGLARFSGFTGLTAVFIAFISAGIADEAQNPGTQEPVETTENSGKATAQVDESTVAAAAEILTQVRSKLEGLDSLKCELHQTATIAGMKMTAFGRYVEASGNRVHLQYFIFPMVNAKAEDVKALALDAAAPAVNETENRGILTQISDGNVLYTTWKNGDIQRVTRRNIHDILAAAQAVSSYDPQNAAMDLGIGGLRGLISRIQTTMEFAVVKTVKAGDRDFLEVTGRWSDRVRKDVFKLPEGTVVDPRPHVPEYVRVYVDSQTMLPSRIQFLKRSMDATQKMVRPLLTLDLRNLVLNEAVDEQLFDFKATGSTSEEDLTREEDLTQQVIQMIQATIQPPATAAPDTIPGVAPKSAPEGTPEK